MRYAARLASMLALALLASSLHATPAQDDEQRFVATLQLGASPDVHYLDDNGKPVSYAAFAQQLGAGRDYSSTSDHLALPPARDAFLSGVAARFRRSNCPRCKVGRCTRAICVDATRW